MFPVVGVYFVWGLSSYSRIFHSFGDVTINGEGLHFFFYLCSALMTIEQQESTSTVTLGIRLKWSREHTTPTIPERLAVELSRRWLSGFEC